ncbi:MAG: ABC transporter ATP-binding protein [Anaerolineae bacterium]|nr:ABC transporter ATP-binding protein [Anaerolineae bacterium]
MSADNVLAEIKNLRTYFHLAEGVVRAVDGVDLTIRAGRTLGVVGESGCGKSITAMSLMRLVPSPGRIEEGEITYYRPVRQAESSSVSDVIDIAALQPNGREMRSIRGNQISMVFQEPMTAMLPVRTVGSQIVEAIKLHHEVSDAEARERAIDTLARVKLPNADRIFDTYPFQLSGGMRQRCVIAMALSCDPNLLIADEPTTALDVTTEAQILDLMRALQADFNMAIMYITHNLGVIAEMADEVAVMYMGKVVEEANVQTIFFSPLHPYTQALLRSIPQLDDVLARAGRKERLQTIKGMVPDPYSILPGCPFHPRCPQFMPGVCDRVKPEVIEVEPGHTVRCLLYKPDSATAEPREDMV